MQKESKMRFKDMTLGQKAEHIWEYYKPMLLGIVLVAAAVIYFIVKLLHPDPDEIMNVTMLNSNAYAVEDSALFERFLEEKGYDPETETVMVNSSLFLNTEEGGQSTAVTYQALVAMLMVGEIDLLAGDESAFALVGINGGLYEIEDILPADLMGKYRDSVYTVEDPETGDKYACGIWLPENNPLTGEGYYGSKVLVGIPQTTQQKELAQELLMYLLDEKTQESKGEGNHE